MGLPNVKTGTQINPTQTYVFKAAEAMTDPRCCAVTVDETGAKIATAGTKPIMGVAIITNDFPLAVGDDVHVQVKDIGLVAVGAAVKAGQELTAMTGGAVTPAAAGDYVVGIALEDGAVGDYIHFQVAKYKSGVASA